MKPVCINCAREMPWVKIGAVIQFNVSDRPYQQWMGDVARCPGCGAQVVTRYGDGPSWQQHTKDPADTPDLIVPDRRDEPLQVPALCVKCTMTFDTIANLNIHQALSGHRR
jgi:DNA-directed RNA polymerase subunit RPC12/RpoP